MDILDPYGRYARAYPVCITIAPVVLALLPFIPDSWDWKLLLQLLSFCCLFITYANR